MGDREAAAECRSTASGDRFDGPWGRFAPGALAPELSDVVRRDDAGGKSAGPRLDRAGETARVPAGMPARFPGLGMGRRASFWFFGALAAPIPVACATASIPLFYFLARRVLGGGTTAALLAMALFAVSIPPIRYAAEVKPYSADLLVSLVLLSLAVAWLQAPGRSRSVWAMAAIAPLAVATSLPSVFIIGEVAVIGFFQVLEQRTTKVTAAYGAFLAAAGSAVAGMIALNQYTASAASRDYLIKYWSTAFPPPWRNPGALAGWLLRAHTGPLFAYPYGVNRLAGLSALIFGCFVVGMFVVKRGNAKVAVLLALPFPLVMAAAVLRRYPYGMSVRLAQFLTPSTILLACAGLAWLCARLRPPALARWASPGLAMILVTAGLWQLGHDLVNPYRTPWDRTGREFARWFWDELSVDGELVCVQTDLGIPFRPGQWAYGTDQYLCLQRIYSRRHQQRRLPRWDTVSPTRPLRCVLLNRMPTEVPGFMNWIDSHRDRYTLQDVRTYRATSGSAVEPKQTYVVCEFVPASQSLAISPCRRELNIITERAAFHGPAIMR